MGSMYTADGPLRDLLAVHPLGALISSDNWESDVYLVGEAHVLKVTKDPETLGNVENRDVRYQLVRFWNSAYHFENAVRDHAVLTDILGPFLPATRLLRGPSPVDGRVTNMTLQARLAGTLVKGRETVLMHDRAFVTAAGDLAGRIERAEAAFGAPLDVHTANMMWDDAGHTLALFDTGTPSDWAVFLDGAAIASLLAVPEDLAQRFAAHMRKHHAAHVQKSKEFVERFHAR
jgi:hypothetical protein